MVTIRTSVTPDPNLDREGQGAIRIITKDIRRLMDRFEKKRPEVFERAIREWLILAGEKVRMESIKIASSEGKGKTSGYMKGFMRSPIKSTGSGGGYSLYTVVYNTQMYSMVLEIGGHWNKMPPPHALEEWVKAKFGYYKGYELNQVVYLIARAIKQNRYSGKGQKFYNAKGRSGRLFTMNRALKKSQSYMQDMLSKKLKEGLKAL